MSHYPETWQIPRKLRCPACQALHEWKQANPTLNYDPSYTPYTPRSGD